MTNFKKKINKILMIKDLSNKTKKKKVIFKSKSNYI